MELVNQLMAFEDGQLNERQTLKLFSKLISSGQAWSLQGSYGRTASALIQQGYLSPDGSIIELV